MRKVALLATIISFDRTLYLKGRDLTAGMMTPRTTGVW